MAQASLVKRLAAHPRWGVYFSFNRTVYILLLFTLGKGFQLSIGQLTINLYVYSITHDLQIVGFVAAMSPLGALLAGVPIGFLADRFGRKSMLVASGLLTPVTLVAIALSANPAVLVLANLANGVAASPYWVTNLPLLTENTSDDQRVGALAMNNFLLLGVGALGALIGSAVPIAVAHVSGLPANSTVPLRFGVLAASLVVLLPALPLFLVHEPPRVRAAPALAASLASGAEGRAIGQTAPADEAAPDPQGRWAVTALFAKLLIPDVLFTTGEGTVIALMQLYFVLKFGLALGTLGILLTVAGLVGGATSLTAPGFVRRWGQLRMATTMQYLSAPVMLVIGFSPLFPLAALAEFVRQILRGLFEPVYAAFAMDSVTTRYRGRLSGFYSLTWSIGFSIGSVVEGWLQRNVSLSASFPVGALCLLTSATLLRTFFGRSRGGTTDKR
jgi:MFS family permease